MQQLQFEASWEKALSLQDRHLIETIFNETKDNSGSAIVFSPIREAVNYKSELLLTVLVHNFSSSPFAFEHTRIGYVNGQNVLAESTFTLPALTIPPHTSMPWTLIFPKDSYTSGPALGHGQLEIRE